jgi:hypothetical protein
VPPCPLSTSFRCSAFGSHAMNELTTSTAASHLAGNFHISAGEEFSKLFTSSFYNIFERNQRLLSSYDVLFLSLLYNIEDEFYFHKIVHLIFLN